MVSDSRLAERSQILLTRASGFPVDSRSEMTATDAAPASITSGARSSVMPPIATIGVSGVWRSNNAQRPRRPGSCRLRGSQCPSSTYRRSVPQQYSPRASATPRAPARASESRCRRSRCRREFVGRRRDRGPPAPRGRHRPPTSLAMSARSFTMTDRSGLVRARDDVLAHRRETRRSARACFEFG